MKTLLVIIVALASLTISHAGQPPANLNLVKNSRIGLIGGGLGSRMNDFNHEVAAADAKTIKLKSVTSNSRRENVYISGKDMESKMTLPEGYEMKLLADEQMFPDLANPSQMAFDNKGRLWVSYIPSYPNYRIGDALPQDKIIFFEDTADKGFLLNF